MESVNVESVGDVTSGLESVFSDLKDNYPIISIGVFGSFASGDFDDESDVDIVVEFEQSKGSLRDLFQIEENLEDVFNRSVDVATLREIEENLSKEELNKVVWV